MFTRKINDEQVKLFLDALAQTYDPHSEYLSKADLKNFSINMGLSLVGIGAMLRTEDGYAKIESLVPGGPGAGRWPIESRRPHHARWRRARADFVDVRDMRLDKVVEMIRGKKGTQVRLLVIPADAPDPSKRKTVELVRDEIKLKDQEARADIIIKKDANGKPVKLGWITLPSFYADMDKHQKSTTQRCAGASEAAEEGKHRRPGGRSAPQRRRLARRSDLADRALFEIRPDRADQRFEREHCRLERSGSGHRLCRSAGCSDQPAKRLRQ